MAGKRGHNSRTQARNARSQFASGHDVFVIYDTDEDRFELQPPTTGGVNNSKGKGPMTRARSRKGEVRSLPIKKDTDGSNKEVLHHCDQCIYTDSDYDSTEILESKEQDHLKWAIELCKNKAYFTVDRYVEKAKLMADEYALRAKNRVDRGMDKLYDDIMSGNLAPPKAKAKKK